MKNLRLENRRAMVFFALINAINIELFDQGRDSEVTEETVFEALTESRAYAIRKSLKTERLVIEGVTPNKIKLKGFDLNLAKKKGEKVQLLSQVIYESAEDSIPRLFESLVSAIPKKMEDVIAYRTAEDDFDYLVFYVAGRGYYLVMSKRFDLNPFDDVHYMALVTEREALAFFNRLAFERRRYHQEFASRVDDNPVNMAAFLEELFFENGASPNGRSKSYSLATVLQVLKNSPILERVNVCLRTDDGLFVRMASKTIVTEAFTRPDREYRRDLDDLLYPFDIGTLDVSPAGNPAPNSLVVNEQGSPRIVPPSLKAYALPCVSNTTQDTFYVLYQGSKRSLGLADESRPVFYLL